MREPYLQMARLGYLENNWPLVYLMTQRGLDITQKSGSYLHEPETWGYSFYDLGAICCYRLGLYEKSLEYAKTACELEENDKRLKNNLELIEQQLKKQSRGKDSE